MLEMEVRSAKNIWCTRFSKVIKMSQTSESIFETVTVVFNVYGNGDKF